MKIISCPIPGRSLIVQFGPAAATVLEEHASSSPAVPSHGLLLGATGGNDPKWLHVHRIQPVFGLGDSTTGGHFVAPDPSFPLITLGYYTIRTNGENLDQVERDFLATSLPQSALIASVITVNPESRMLAQFYLRDAEGGFGPVPDHRQLLIAQETDGPSIVPPRSIANLEVAPPPPPAPRRSRKIDLVLALTIAAILIALALNRQPSHAQPTATPAPVEKPTTTATVVVPQPTFVLPVKSVRLIQDPPEVAIWYPDPARGPAPAPSMAEARHSVLVHPILSQDNPH